MKNLLDKQILLRNEEKELMSKWKDLVLLKKVNDNNFEELLDSEIRENKTRRKELAIQLRGIKEEMKEK